MLNTTSVQRAICDLDRISKRIKEDPMFKETIPPDFLWFMEHNDGNLFVTLRANYYDFMTQALGKVTDLDMVTETMEKQSANILRDRLYDKLDAAIVSIKGTDLSKAMAWIVHMTKEAGQPRGDEDSDLDEDFDGDLHFGYKDYIFHKKKKVPRIQTGDLIDVITGHYDSDDGTDLLRARTIGRPSSTLRHISRSIMRRKIVKPKLSSLVRGRDRMEVASDERLCNEEMNAGRAEALYQEEETEEYFAVCSCHYTKYLTGPMCKHRTYRFVIDYDKWERTGYPEFLVDPIAHFSKAEKVCKDLDTNSRAVYDSSNKGFLCAPVSELVKGALTFRGSHEPSLFIEREINKESNAPSSQFKINWKYLDLLGRIREEVL